MQLHEIITHNEKPTSSILIELLLPYKKSLLTYYTDLFGCEPVLMVVSVSNAAQYGKIVPSSEFEDAICKWMEVDYIPTMEEDEDAFAEYETISFNSILLSKL